MLGIALASKKITARMDRLYSLFYCTWKKRPGVHECNGDVSTVTDQSILSALINAIGVGFHGTSCSVLLWCGESAVVNGRIA
jgi:hypothetical protein